MSDIEQQAKTLTAAAVALIEQVLNKHTEAVLEEVHDQIKARNARIAELTADCDATRLERDAQRVSVNRLVDDLVVVTAAAADAETERDALREEIAGWKVDQKENLRNQCDLVAECNALRAFAQEICEYQVYGPTSWEVSTFAKQIKLLDEHGNPTPLLTGE